jgi:hypothetical protein
MPSVDCLRSVPIERTPRVKQLEGMFDIRPAQRSERRWRITLPIEERDWNVGLIVGPSGCGKTTLARELFGVQREPDWPTDRATIDAFPSELGIKKIVTLLSSVGFSSPPSWLRPYNALSTGEQFRVRIARILAESNGLAVVDEFTSVVDRTVARIGSTAITRTIRAAGKRFVAVTCHYDVVDWLNPDWMYDPAADQFAWRSLRGRPAIALEICRVDRSAWRLFKHHHYLNGELNPSAQCFVAFVEEQPAAFAAVISGPDRYGGHFREHRVACLPDFQGVGIGNALSEFVASLFATRKRYFSRTSHPGMIRHRMKSPDWLCISRPRFTSRHGHSGFARTGSARRLAASFRFVGCLRLKEAKDFGIMGRTTRRRKRSTIGHSPDARQLGDLGEPR